MSEITNLQNIQRRIYQLMTFEDGLWDLLLGTIFMLLAFYPVTRARLGPEWNLVLFISLLALVVVAQLAIQHFVSRPRVGYAKMRRTPKLGLLAVFTLMLVLVTIGLVTLTFFGWAAGSAASLPEEISNGRSYTVELIVMLVMGCLFAVMGYLFGVVRLYFYGWMIGFANLASVYMEHTAGWTFFLPLAVAAGIIILIGLVLLVRFLRKYPLRTEGS
jgi:hypothetical protein